jgi:hypothetical protein
VLRLTTNTLIVRPRQWRAFLDAAWSQVDSGMMATMRVVQVSRPAGPFEIVERMPSELPPVEAARGKARFRVVLRIDQ